MHLLTGYKWGRLLPTQTLHASNHNVGNEIPPSREAGSFQPPPTPLECNGSCIPLRSHCYQSAYLLKLQITLFFFSVPRKHQAYPHITVRGLESPTFPIVTQLLFCHHPSLNRSVTSSGENFLIILAKVLFCFLLNT